MADIDFDGEDLAAAFRALGAQHQRALENCLISPNEVDSNWEAANVVDGLFAIARAIRALSTSIDALAAPKHADNDSA